MSLSSKWKQGLAHAASAQAAVTAKEEEATASAFAEAVIAKIPDAVNAAIAKGEKQVEVGEFRATDLPSSPSGTPGGYYPERHHLQGAALLIYEYCLQEGLHLFVGGDFRMRGSWAPPFEIIIRLER